MNIGCTLDFGHIIDLGCWLLRPTSYYKNTPKSASRTTSVVAELVLPGAIELHHPLTLSLTITLTHKYRKNRNEGKVFNCVSNGGSRGDNMHPF